MKQLSTDVLIIGAGGAGLMAALAATDAGADVLVVNKGLSPETSTTNVASGIGAVVTDSHGDSVGQHFTDTIKAGQFLNDQRLVRIMVEEVGPIVEELLRLGCRFDTEPDGSLRQLKRGGHSYRRLCIAGGDRGGREILLSLMRQLRGRSARLLDLFHVHSLLPSGDGVGGAVGLDLATGEPLAIGSRAVVLASGGSARLFPMSSIPPNLNGDGYDLGLEAGAELVDMEMVQFHPGGLCLPGVYLGVSGSEPAHYAAMGGRLLNGAGERFMERYDPRLESATRDVVSRAEFLEIRAGRGGPRGGVYLDLEELAPETRERLKQTNRRLYETCLSAGIDITRGDRVEVAPTLHYIMGGLRIDEDGATSVPGLYACGEVAGGIHGANRIAGNALADCLVFGRRAGRSAALRSRDGSWPTVDEGEMARSAEEMMRPLDEETKPGALRPHQVEARIQGVMWQHGSVVRNRSGLLAAREALGEIKGDLLPRMGVAAKERVHNLEWLRYLEVKSLLKLAELVAESALIREESRGAHYREDFPARDDGRWLANVVVARAGEGLAARLEPVATDLLRPGD